MLGQSGGGLDLASIVGNVASGGVGGTILLIIVSLMTDAVAKAKAAKDKAVEVMTALNMTVPQAAAK
jgi:hypothetical protein